jgi:hypothetical protein
LIFTIAFFETASATAETRQLKGFTDVRATLKTADQVE